MIKTSPIIPDGMMGTAVYNGIDCETMKVIFSKHIPLTTQNAIDFIGCVHGLMHMKKHGLNGHIFIESIEIKKSIEDIRNIFYDPIKDPKAELTNDLMAHCIRWLIEQKSLPHIALMSQIQFPENENV